MASEHKQRALAQELTGGVAGEYALFSFPDKRRGEVFRRAAFVWVEDLEQKIVDDRFECTVHLPQLPQLVHSCTFSFVERTA